MTLLIRKSIISKVLTSILLICFAGTTPAHTYFFGVTDINLNPKSEHIEIIHQLTVHDIENAIAQIQQVHFYPEHLHYDEFIQDYIEQHFDLSRNNQKIELHWLGFEVKRGQLFAYQESTSKNSLKGLKVKNTLLVDVFEKQINTVNYQSGNKTSKVQGSLTFNQETNMAVIPKK